MRNLKESRLEGDPKTLHVEIPTGASELQARDRVARTVVDPTGTGGVSVYNAFKLAGVKAQMDVKALSNALQEQVDAVVSGDMTRPQSMLVCQAHALDVLFLTLAEKAGNADYMRNMEAYMRLALRAQNQARMTLETLSEIKHPRTVFAEQANIANGHQQVNNYAPDSRNPPNQKTEVADELLPDTRASGTEIQVDPSMETLGKDNRAKVRRG